MSFNKPDFDFTSYNPKDPWNFPADRMVIFGIEAMEIFRNSRVKYAPRHQYPDVRFAVFHELIQLCHGTMSVGIWLRGEGGNRQWWNQQPEFNKEYSKRMVQSFNMGLRGLQQTGFLHGIGHQIESSLRQCLVYLDPTAEENLLGYRKVWKRLFGALEMEMWEPLLKLWLVMRESVHHSGKFCPASRKDLAIEFKGKTYNFYNNKEIEPEEWGFFDDYDFFLFLLFETDRMFNTLFDKPELRSIRRILLRHQEPPKE